MVCSQSKMDCSVETAIRPVHLIKGIRWPPEESHARGISDACLGLPLYFSGSNF